MLSDVTRQDIDFFFHSESISGFRKSEIGWWYISVTIPLDPLLIEKKYLHIEDEFYVLNFWEPKFRSMLNRKLNYLKEKNIISQYFLQYKESENTSEKKQYYLEKYWSDAGIVMQICDIGSVELVFIPEKVNIFERIHGWVSKLVCKEALVLVLQDHIWEILMTQMLNMDRLFDWIHIEDKYKFYDLNLTIRALLEYDTFNVVKIYRFLKNHLSSERVIQLEKDIRNNWLPSLNLQVIEIDSGSYYTWTSLKKWDKEETLWAYQIKICDYFFGTEPFKTEWDSETLAGLLYWAGWDDDIKNKNLKETYEEINKKAKRIGITSQLFWKIDNKILLKMKK
jgi:hypothetical protein